MMLKTIFHFLELPVFG